MARLAGLAYYARTEPRCVGSPRSLSAGLRLTAFSSLFGRRSLASRPANYTLARLAGLEPATPSSVD